VEEQDANLIIILLMPVVIGTIFQNQAAFRKIPEP